MKRSSLPLVVSDRFYTLVRAANDYYNSNAGYAVALQFMEAVEQGLGKIEAYASAGQRYRPPDGFKPLKDLHYRQLNLANFSVFPYTIYFEVEARRIVVHVIYHHSRNRDMLLHS